jgi:hypothetical protein
MAATSERPRRQQQGKKKKKKNAGFFNKTTPCASGPLCAKAGLPLDLHRPEQQSL